LGRITDRAFDHVPRLVAAGDLRDDTHSGRLRVRQAGLAKAMLFELEE